jgi:hypothetical protein
MVLLLGFYGVQTGGNANGATAIGSPDGGLEIEFL